MLFKGPFGFGKTLAAASFALDGPVHLSYWDKKRPIELITYFTRERFGDKAAKIIDNITYDVYGAENAGDYLNWLLDTVRNCPYHAVINDSLTFMTAGAVNWSMNFGKDAKVKRKIKDVLPDWDEYKVETSLVTQCIDICKKLPCHVIWTAHPLPTTKVDGSGASMRVTKTNSLVSYGSKVAGIVPGSFTEIYHFSQQSNWDSSSGKSSKRYIAMMDSIGDEFAKSPLLSNAFKELDFTDKLFYEVWKDAIKVAQDKLTSTNEGETNQSITEERKLTSPFSTQTTEQPKWKT
jgi:hypothetical protein